MIIQPDFNSHNTAGVLSNKKIKYIFVTGGVISGIGKGIVASSIGLLLKSYGIAVTNVKIDMYLNIDAGTIRPAEHGEVFVTDDGIETDQDIGNYERFLNTSLRRENYLTTGQIYKAVIDKERAFYYQGEDVEAIPYITDEIIERINKAANVNNAEVVIIELGGTAGEIQNQLFFEASRILRLKKPEDVIQIHVTYLPFIKHLGELKSKPAQQSVHILNSMGIQPDFLIARSEKAIDQRRRERLALFCNMNDDDIIANPDLESIYEVPVYLEKQGLTTKIINKLNLKFHTKNLNEWENFTKNLKDTKKSVKIALVGKYFKTGDYTLSDSYLCVIEAIKHASSKFSIKPEMEWVNSEDIEKNGVEILKKYDGVIVPQGWGSRGTNGKILTAKYCRENKVPYLGLCFGMQMAVIEFARNVLHLSDATSSEIDPESKNPVIHIMENQKEYLAKHQYGGTIRLGVWPAEIKKNSKLWQIYESSDNSDFQLPVVQERHRHRYEFNQKYLTEFEENGLIASALSLDGKLVEAIEIKNHPFFIGVQYHPEYKSRPLSPHPIFMAFIKALIH